jgi:hypothetical protein
MRSPTPEQSALLDRICRLIEKEYLPGISDPVRAGFADAMHAWRSAQKDSVDDAFYVSRFALMARTLTHPHDIFRTLNDQAIRKL